VAAFATVGGKTYRIVNAHLEVDTFPSVQQAQVAELIDTFAHEPGPLIVLGDFNSPAPDGPVYQSMVRAGYLDAWMSCGNRPGFTGCQTPNLDNLSSILDQRIDFVFACNGVLPLQAVTIGDQDDARTASGQWPSDHAGVSAVLDIR
jgi:endonuclease/exonuclease/phosphatase family metal-dependent hydrolase